jgi:hypothetical protein
MLFNEKKNEKMKLKFKEINNFIPVSCKWSTKIYCFKCFESE